jgi:hypothetical protein
VSGAGDVNGDGFADLVVGASGASGRELGSGAGYVIFGKAGGFNPTLNLAALDGRNGFKLAGEEQGDRAGYSVSGAGDVNGDGFDDVIVGVHTADGNSRASYVVLGGARGFGATVNLDSLDGSNGFTIYGEVAIHLLGGTVSEAGDVNGDGFDDIIVGARATGVVSGASYVVFGQFAAIRPVAFSADFKTATFTDVDGDIVTVKTTKGTLDATNFGMSRASGAVTGGAAFNTLDLNSAEFAKANITITAKRGRLGGDGLVNLGFLDATGIALGKVCVDGDLQRVDAANVGALTVYSMGQFAAGVWEMDELTSNFTGKLGALTIKTDASRVAIAAETIGAIKAGNLEGVKIVASGVLNPAKAANALAIKSIAISGSVKFSDILAGYNAAGEPVNADVQIGKVAVKGQWIASDLIAGATAGADEIFGTADDARIAGGGAIVSKLASITIGGAAFGTVDEADDGFGFVAEELGKISIGKAKLTLIKEAGNDLAAQLFGATLDVRIREVA